MTNLQQVPPAQKFTKDHMVVDAPDKTMDFPDAIRQVIDGKRITKLEWKDAEEFGVLLDGKLKIHRHGKFFDWLINDGDLTGEDWIVI